MQIYQNKIKLPLQNCEHQMHYEILIFPNCNLFKNNFFVSLILFRYCWGKIALYMSFYYLEKLNCKLVLKIQFSGMKILYFFGLNTVSSSMLLAHKPMHLRLSIWLCVVQLPGLIMCLRIRNLPCDNVLKSPFVCRTLNSPYSSLFYTSATNTFLMICSQSAINFYQIAKNETDQSKESYIFF